MSSFAGILFAAKLKKEVVIIRLTKQEYKELYQKHSPASPSLINVPTAFLVGGGICALGQLLLTLYTRAGLEKTAASAAVSCTLIALGVILTAVRVFEHIAKHAGAGTLVPITGFANAVASTAIEFRDEGFVLGTAAKMFTIAGPVIVWGVSASVIYGVIYWLTQIL